MKTHVRYAVVLALKTPVLFADFRRRRAAVAYLRRVPQHPLRIERWVGIAGDDCATRTKVERVTGQAPESVVWSEETL